MNGSASGGRHVYPRASSLASLSGAHPDALRSLYIEGRPTDPAELGEAPRGEFLAFGETAELYFVSRPLVRLFGLFPWEGKVFDHGGNSGKNLVFGKQLLRFHAEIAASLADGRPALVLSYDVPEHKNPWPLSAIVDELRTVGDGIAIGPVFFKSGVTEPRLLLWFGLEIR